MNLKKIDPKFSKKTNPRIGLIALASDFIIEKDVSESNKLPKIQALTQNKLFNIPPKKTSDQNQKINSNVSSNLYMLEKLTPYNLGFLISSWEHKTFICSQLLQINPFDQFGVEQGKLKTSKKI